MSLLPINSTLLCRSHGGCNLQGRNVLVVSQSKNEEREPSEVAYTLVLILVVLDTIVVLCMRPASLATTLLKLLYTSAVFIELQNRVPDPQSVSSERRARRKEDAVHEVCSLPAV